MMPQNLAATQADKARHLISRIAAAAHPRRRSWAATARGHPKARAHPEIETHK